MLSVFQSSFSTGRRNEDEEAEILDSNKDDLHELRAQLRKESIEDCDSAMMNQLLEDKIFLEQCLRCRKNNVDQARHICTNFVRFRRSVSWGIHLYARDVNLPLREGVHWLLPPDKYGRLVVCYNPRFFNFDTTTVEDYQKMGSYLMQRAIAAPLELRKSGIVLVFDLAGARHAKFIKKFSVQDVHRGIGMWKDTFPCQLKQIVICGATTGLRVFVRAIKMLLSTKMRERISLSGPGPQRYDELHRICGTECLPEELGGTLLKSRWSWQQVVDDWVAQEQEVTTEGDPPELQIATEDVDVVIESTRRSSNGSGNSSSMESTATAAIQQATAAAGLPKTSS